MVRSAKICFVAARVEQREEGGDNEKDGELVQFSNHGAPFVKIFCKRRREDINVEDMVDVEMR